MPLVRVVSWNLPEERLVALVSALPDIVSNALSVGDVGHDGFLSMNDIEVVVRRGDPLDIHGDADFGINVEAMYFEERKKMLPSAKETIKAEVLELVSGYAGYVWITLPVADFVEIGKD